MATDEQFTPVEILLSREELLFLLSVLQAQFLPGLDEDPEGSLTSAQQELALRVARRALQARELLRIRPDGEYALHNSLLRAVGVCAYPQNTIFAYHWPPNNESPIRTFFHIRGNDGVMHTRPDPALHRFALMPAAQVPSYLANVCQLREDSQQANIELSISNQAFLQARQQIDNGDLQAAQRSLESGGASPEVANLFAKSLSGSIAVSILQIVKQSGASVEKQDITLIQNGVHGWIMQPRNPEDTSHLHIRSLQADTFLKSVSL